MTLTSRNCPFCNASSCKELFTLSARDFCDNNRTYSARYNSILSLNSGDKFPIVRCVSCGFVYAALLPKDEFSAILYDEVIDTKFAEKASLETGDYVRRLRYIGTLMQIAAKESARILDFGAGFGMSSRIIGLAGLEVIAYDSSITRQAHQVASSVKSCCNWSEVTKAGPYTAVICDNVLEHVADLHQTLRQLTTVMEQGAILYVSVPSYEQSVIARLQKEYTGGVLSDPSLNPWEHLNYFDLYHLDSLLNGHGFNVVKTNELPGIVNVGLRPEPAIFARCKNGLASIKRIFGYIVRGTVLDSVNSRFYRFLEK